MPWDGSKLNRGGAVRLSLFFLLLAILVAVWFHNVIIYDNIFSYGDLSRYFYPLRHFASDAVKSGRMPLWNPYIKNGTPLLATLQACVLYPVSLIYYVSPSFEKAFNWYIILHFFLAGVFMYLLMRRWKASWAASSISSFVFVFGGYLTSVITMNTSLSSAVWLPLTVLLFDAMLRRQSFGYALATGAALAVQFLGGEPTVIYGTLWFMLFYFAAFSLVRLVSSRDIKKAVRAGALFAAAGLTALALAAIQLIPFAEFLSMSTRAHGEGFEAITRWSLIPQELFNLIIPFFLGETSSPGGMFAVQDWMASLYVGVMPLLLAAFALALRPGRKTVFLAMAALFSIFLAMGRSTPLYGFLYEYIPGFRYIRYPVKFLFMFSFILSALAGIGYDRLIERQGSLRSGRFAAALVAANGILALGLVLFLKFWGPVYRELVKNYALGGLDIVPSMRALAIVYISDSAQLCRLFIVMTAVVIPLVFFIRGRMRVSTFGFISIAIVFFDLASVNMGISKVTGADLFRLEPPSYTVVKQDRSMFRTMQTDKILKINRSIWGPHFAAGQHERKATFSSNIPMVYGIYDSQGYESLFEADRAAFMYLANGPDESVDRKMISLLNVKYVISVRPLEGAGFEPVWRGLLARFPIAFDNRRYAYFYINRNNSVMGRAFFVKDYIMAHGRQETLGYLKSDDFDPAAMVILEEEPVLCGAEGQPSDREALSITRYEPEEVLIEARLNEPKFLILSDSYYPGWKAFVDGEEARIYKAYGFLRAVYLREGRHVVRFVFDPLSYRIGRYISLSTLCAIVLYGAAEIYRRRRRDLH